MECKEYIGGPNLVLGGTPEKGYHQVCEHAKEGSCCDDWIRQIQFEKVCSVNYGHLCRGPSLSLK